MLLEDPPIGGDEKQVKPIMRLTQSWALDTANTPFSFTFCDLWSLYCHLGQKTMMYQHSFVWRFMLDEERPTDQFQSVYFRDPIISPTIYLSSSHPPFHS